ncbi:MAG: hypothetical protein HY000_30515 [Planctomycetes bacterium]|nr:hypothetical protein [Planctomycetota bacterium]
MGVLVKEFFSYVPNASMERYTKHFNVVGQADSDACVATCVHMLLNDRGIQDTPDGYPNSQSVIRSILGDQSTGVLIASVPDCLAAYEVRSEFQNSVEIDLLLNLSQELPCLTSVSVGKDFHALLVDGFHHVEGRGTFVCIRDPLPVLMGSRYNVHVDTFTAVWTKRAVILHR